MGFADAYLLDASRSVLIVVDVQTRLLDVMHESQTVVANIRKLAFAAQVCHVPILCTTQNAEKLGPVHPEVAELLLDVVTIDKMTFSCLGNDSFRSALDKMPDRTQAVLAGVEAHVCINQTAHDLLNEGFVVHMPADAIASRTDVNYRYGLERLRHVGATVSVTESIIFEWLRRAGTDEFRKIAPWLK